jgi:Ca2+/H+ antiporter, TMEM165/GDT1 family
VLAELGDKTMLATVTLAADNDWVGVWLGSTIGMVAADALAIVVGAVAGKHLPERSIQLAAAALFLAFGVGMLVDGIFPAAPVPVVLGSAVAVVVLFAVVLRALPKRLRPAGSRAEPVSLTVNVEPGSDNVPDVR